MSHAKEFRRGIARLIVGAAFALATQAACAQAPAAAVVGKEGLQTGMRPWKGDFEAMAKRRLVRVLVPFSKTFYYVENGRSRGVSAEIIQALEDDINRERKTGKTLRIRVVALPVGRDELLPKLNAGYGDIVIADLTVTPERLKIVDFATPMFRGIPEVVVTGPAGADVPNLAALAGKEVFVRKGTSYWEHLEALNKRFASESKAPVVVREAPDDLEAEDILEMVDVGLVAGTVVDRYKARIWQPVFKGLKIQEGARVNEGGEYAFAVRQNSPELKVALNGFVKRHGQGTAFGNTIVSRYVKNPKFVKNAAGDSERQRFGATVDLFRRYGDKYDVDYMLMMAQGFQESGLDQNAKSHVARSASCRSCRPPARTLRSATSGKSTTTCTAA